jgi:hypothetical protein
MTFVSRIALVAAVAASAIAVCSTVGMAKGAKPGLYDLAGEQELCLQSDGTWFYTTFSGNIGGWTNVHYKDVKTILWGSYNSGVGQDSITVKNGAADWLEFHNDGSLVSFQDKVTFTRIADSCTAPSRLPNKHANPMD